MRSLRLAFIWILGAGLSCGAPPVPVVSVHQPPIASQSIEAPAAPRGELSVVAEGEHGLVAATLDNALLLQLPIVAGGASWDVIRGGRIERAADPGAAVAEDSRASDRLTGRFPDGVALVHLWLDNWSRQDSFLGSSAHVLRDGKWHKIGQEDAELYLDVWESPRGCWLGIAADSWFTRQAAAFSREALECPVSPPPPLRASSDGGVFLVLRGLPDGGVAGVHNAALTDAFFDSDQPKSLPEIVIWDRAGARRSLSLPPPSEAAKGNLPVSSMKILIDPSSALLVIGELETRTQPSEIFLYAARCDASVCKPLPLPVTSLQQAELAEDGSLLVSGTAKKETEWALWTLPPKGEWRRAGRPPARFDGLTPTAIYGASVDDVWVVVETPKAPVKSALLRSKPGSR